MATNASILDHFHTEHRSWDVLARIVEGLADRRDRGELQSVPRNKAISLKWLNDKDQVLNQLAVSEDAYYRGGSEPARKRRGGMEPISGLLGRKE